MINTLKDKVLNGYLITKEEALALSETDDLNTLCDAANQIRNHFCGNKFDICSIINAKSGKCSENCKYCAQSSFYHSNIDEYPLLPTDKILSQATSDHSKGVLRYSAVTSGKRLSDEEVDSICESYKAIKKACSVSLCASHGLLNKEQFEKLKQAGVTRYHNNLETSKNNFKNICTSHTFEDKIAAITAAQEAGLEVCSGGIMGLGETMEDRIDLAFSLRELKVNSVPINILNPIKGTPFENLPVLDVDTVRRIVALFRFILPTVAIRLAGGRGLLSDKGKGAFCSGANAVITGDMLTTQGISIKTDIDMVTDLGFEVGML